jgi:tRNA threonylcarbamoyladenosine biosynthesis protein TsaE
MKHRLIIPAPGRIDDVASRFLQLAGERPVIAFSGEMGAGKTTFIQAVCRQLGVDTDVNSPTFALINEYFTGSGESVYHFDLYRIEDPEELFDVGYEEYFYSGRPCFIEWPEKADHLIPGDALRVRIDVLGDGSRELSFSDSA